MRVLHVFHFAGVGGVETYARLVLAELESRGHENVVVHGGPFPPGGGPNRIAHHVPELDQPWFRARSTSHRLKEILGRTGADVACIHTPLLDEAAKTMYSALPTVFFAHNYGSLCPSGARFYSRGSAVCELRGTPDHRCLINAYVKRCNSRRPSLLAATFALAGETNRWVRRLPLVVCGSEYVARACLQSGVMAGKLRVLHYGVEAAPQRRSRQSPPTVLFAGRLIRHKGAHNLIRAFPQVPAPARLLVSGSGPELPGLRRLAAELGIDARAEFLGDLPPPRQLYPRALLLVVPSIWPEPFGLVGPEAMAHGLPVVASRIGGIPEWLEDGETGFLVEPGDVQALSERINTLLDDRPLARRLGARAAAAAARRFTVPGYVDRMLELLQDATVFSASPEPELVPV